MTTEERKNIQDHLDKLRAIVIKDLATKCLINQLEQQLKYN